MPWMCVQTYVCDHKMLFLHIWKIFLNCREKTHQIRAFEIVLIWKKIIFRVTTRIHENFTLVIQTIYEIEAYKILKMYFFTWCAKKIADWCFKKIPLRITSAIFYSLLIFIIDSKQTVHTVQIIDFSAHYFHHYPYACISINNN